MTVSFFTGRWTKSATQINNNAGETKFIKTDTSFIPVQKNLNIVKSIKAINKIDTTKNKNSIRNYYSAEFDTLIAVDKDSILTKTKVKFDMAKTQFAIEQEISYRTFDRMITDSKYLYDKLFLIFEEKNITFDEFDEVYKEASETSKPK